MGWVQIRLRRQKQKYGTASAMQKDNMIDPKSKEARRPSILKRLLIRQASKREKRALRLIRPRPMRRRRQRTIQRRPQNQNRLTVIDSLKEQSGISHRYAFIYCSCWIRIRRAWPDTRVSINVHCHTQSVVEELNACVI